MLNSRTGRIASVAAAVLATVALGAGTANAVFYSDYTTAANIRSTPYTSGTIYGVGYPGHGTNDWCWTLGTSVNGLAAWDDSTDRATGVRGYVSENYIANAYTGQTTHC
ncbi:hypothetical protein [Kitasatospora sp. NPDC004272]